MAEEPSPNTENYGDLLPFFEMSLDMLCIAGPDGYFKRINAAWERILGYTREELLAHPYVHFVHPDDRERTIAEAARLSQGIDTISFENRYRHRNGSYRWLLWRSTTDPKANLIYAAARDITEQKSAEEKLQRTTEELQRSNEELAQFAYVASHDLQEPLRMVTSFLQLIDKRYADKLDDDGRRYIHFAVDGGKRMQVLIQDLLALSRLETGSRPDQIADCAKVFQDVMRNLHVAIEETGATVTCDALPSVVADPIQMTQLLQNLILNALKFRSKEPARIHIGVRREPEEWIFSVQDNGIGIEPQYHERIFGIFQRLHSRTELPGTGIGLAVCKKIVERHGGRIWVESKPGQGAKFLFTIRIRSVIRPGLCR